MRVYPFKTIEAGAFVNTSVIWESRGQAHLFGARGVSGILNVEITPGTRRAARRRVRDDAEEGRHRHHRP